jgi:hypothetical protein
MSTLPVHLERMMPDCIEALVAPDDRMPLMTAAPYGANERKSTRWPDSDSRQHQTRMLFSSQFDPNGSFQTSNSFFCCGPNGGI